MVHSMGLEYVCYNIDTCIQYIDFNHSVDNSAVDIEGAITLGNDLIFISWNSGLFVYNYQKEQFTRYLVNNSNFPSNWETYQLIDATNAKEANKRALNALQNDVSGLCFSNPNN